MRPLSGLTSSDYAAAADLRSLLNVHWLAGLIFGKPVGTPVDA
ncbi:MAG TPA: hypothetical protein VHY84_12405 [Bryobacteraceae bacterium]|jgi:hypothetical protein|nr:hypothetical protein [Bryobacteraceae bacterium]